MFSESDARRSHSTAPHSPRGRADCIRACRGVEAARRARRAVESLPLPSAVRGAQDPSHRAPGFGCSIDNVAGRVLSRVWHCPLGERNALGLAGLVASGTRWLQRQSIDKRCVGGVQARDASPAIVMLVCCRVSRAHSASESTPGRADS